MDSNTIIIKWPYRSLSGAGLLWYYWIVLSLVRETARERQGDREAGRETDRKRQGDRERGSEPARERGRQTNREAGKGPEREAVRETE